MHPERAGIVAFLLVDGLPLFTVLQDPNERNEAKQEQAVKAETPLCTICLLSQSSTGNSSAYRKGRGLSVEGLTTNPTAQDPRSCSLRPCACK